MISDAAGASDIASVQVIINGSSSDYASCHVAVIRGKTDTIYLLNDNGSAYLGPVSPGGAGALQNSQCRLDGRNTTVSVAGGAFTARFAMNFSASFAGTKNIYVEAHDNAGLTSGWQQRGSWSVPAP